MRALLGGLLVLLCFSIIAVPAERELAPRFSARTMSGERVSNDSIKGKVVLLQFWTTWCRYCRSEQEIVDQLEKEFAGKDFLVLAVDVGESKKTVKKYLAESPRNVRIVLTEDTNLAAMYAATVYPIYVLIDREGYVVARQNGADGEEALRRMLAKVGLASEQAEGE